MMLKVVLILGSTLVNICNSQQDYCAIEKELCGLQSHIQCNMSVDPTVKNFPGRLLTHFEKQLIVIEFNKYRIKYKKLAVEWNKEFEFIAQAVFFVPNNVVYCYATKDYSKVFMVDYQIIYSLDRNIDKAIECLVETNATVLRVTGTTQIGCVVYSPDLNEYENIFLHANYRLFCILNGEFSDKEDSGMYNTCIKGKRDKIDLPINKTKRKDGRWSLVVQICIWILLILVIYLIGLIATLLYVVVHKRDLILGYFQNKRLSVHDYNSNVYYEIKL